MRAIGIMKTGLIVSLCTMFAFLALAATAPAQVIESPGSPGAAGRIENGISTAGKYQNYVYGVVKEVGKSELVLDKTRYGDNQVFKIEAKTKFIHNGKKSTLADLKVGEMVWVDAKTKKKSGDMIARKVITGVAATGSVR